MSVCVDARYKCLVLACMAVCSTSFSTADEPSSVLNAKVPHVSADHVQRMRKGEAIFKDKVRGILTKHCLDCHGGKSVKADFDLSTRESLMQSGYVGELASESHLMDLITHAAEPAMPLQSERIPNAAIESIRKWIDLGAPFDRPLVEGKRTKESVKMVVTDEHREHWAFQPLREVALPVVQNQAWCRTPIDHFILARQEAVGIHPNTDVESRTLIRRGTFDLQGLLANPEAVDRFVARERADAWSETVDDLLESPHYGERWARHWMDVARFAESHGYEQDYDRPYAYHYRDFLIQAFNRDLPFDTFLQWQLAGDEFAPQNPLALMATGFLGAGAFPTQLTETEFESARYDELDDMVTTTGVAFLGLSVGCARCHDHKFDPIPSSDYYRLAATFTTAIRSEIELDLQPEKNRQRKIEYQSKLAELEEKLRRLETEQVPDEFREWIAGYNPTEVEGPWETLRVIDIQSSGGSTFEPQGDGSWLAIGEAPPQEVLTIIAESSGAAASKLRLETLTHDSLPRKGPGRAGNGNFALGDLRLSYAASKTPDATSELNLVKAVATHQQNSNALSVMSSIDEDAVSGWAVDHGGIGKDQAAVFEFDAAVRLENPTRWRIQLTFNHPNRQHAVGRFRLSLSHHDDAPVVTGTVDIDPSVRLALVEAKSHRETDSDSWKRAQAWFAQTLPEWQECKRAIDDHVKQGEGTQLTKVMVTSEGLPHMKHNADSRGFPHFYPETYFLTRGDVQQKQGVATPGFLQVLTPAERDASHWLVPSKDQTSPTSFRRATLANWMTDPEQGAGALVARVIVNRIWQHHFGHGIVPTPNDFGISGDLPSHPDLLEWLANDLVKHGWHLKRLHRMIMTSSVYMQSADYDAHRAEVDRENRLLWRWEPRRLEAEAIRDSMLIVSGNLDPTMYGPGTLDQNMTRRSVYFFIKRSKLIPMMMLFDWPEHLVSIGQRSNTTVAPQALMFLNSPQGRQYATTFALKLPKDSLKKAVVEGYRLAFARMPTPQEQTLALAFLERQRAEYRSQQADDPTVAALTDFCQTMMSMSEFIYIE